MYFHLLELMKTEKVTFAQMGELLECRYVTTFAVVWIEIL